MRCPILTSVAAVVVLMIPVTALMAETEPQQDPTVIRDRTIESHDDLFALAQVGQQITLSLFEDVSVFIIVDRVDTRAEDRLTLIGHVDGRPDSEVLIVVNDDVIAGVLRMPPTATYRIRSAGPGRLLVMEVDEARQQPCAGGGNPAPPGGVGRNGLPGPNCDDGSIIDVLVLYTPLARNGAGGTAAIEAEVDLAAAAANQAYENSQIDTRINVVHVAETNYDEDGNYTQHLNRLTSPSDGIMDEVHTLRELYGADMVGLFVADNQYCGIAWLMQNLSHDFESVAFSVTTWYCDLTFAHELGHNMGVCHAIGDGGGCDGGGLYPYSNGHRFDGDSQTQWRTVMAYAPGSRITNFSNPDVLFDGQPTGIPEGQGGAADNARTINESAYTVANFRCHIETYIESAKFLADDGVAGDRFGVSAAISGTTAILGALYDSDNGTDSGSAYLLDTVSGQQLFKLLPNDGAEDDLFGRSVGISTSFLDGVAIVGASWDDDNGWNSGSAYLFDVTGNQIAKLLPDDGAVTDNFGFSVAINDTRAIVGAHLDNDNGGNSGSAYLFDISDPANPIQVAKLLPDDGAEGDAFGVSVAINSTTADEIAIVGAYWDDDSGDLSGSAYLFDISDPANPVQTAKLLPDDGAANDSFGFSVAISGATAIVGAVFDDDNGSNSGSAYLFDTATGEQIAKLLPSDGTPGDRFGNTVAIGGPPGNEVAIVGAKYDDYNGGASGSAYLFDIATGQQIAKLLPTDGAEGSRFGASVAISGVNAIISAEYDDNQNGIEAGAAYLFVVEAGGDTGASPAALISCSFAFGSTDNPPCDVDKLVIDDDIDQILRSQFGFTAFERNLAEIVIEGNAADAATMVSIETRDGSDTTNVVAKVKGRNYTTNSIVDIAQYDVSFPSDDTVHSTSVFSSDYIGGNGDIEVRLRYVAPATFTPLGFTVGLDQVQVMVQ